MHAFCSHFYARLAWSQDHCLLRLKFAKMSLLVVMLDAAFCQAVAAPKVDMQKKQYLEMTDVNPVCTSKCKVDAKGPHEPQKTWKFSECDGT